KTANLKKNVPAKEATGGTGPEDPARLEVGSAERLPVAPFAGDAAQVIAITGTIHQGSLLCVSRSLAICWRGAQNQGCHRRHPRILKPSQRPLRPASGHFRIVIQ